MEEEEEEEESHHEICMMMMMFSLSLSLTLGPPLPWRALAP